MAYFGTLFRVMAAIALILVPFLFAKVASAMEISAKILIEIGTDVANLNAKIAAAPKGAVVVLKTGNHTFDAPLKVTRDDITLRGEGVETTKLTFDFAPQKGKDFISVRGGKKSRAVELSKVAEYGSRQIALSKSLNLKAGDAVYIQTPNTRQWIAQNGWSNVRWEEAERRPFRESIHRVIAVEGETVTLHTALPFETNASTTVQKIELLKNVALKDFAITSTFGPANSTRFENAMPEWSGGATIMASRTDGLKLENIEITDSPSSAFILSSSIHADVDVLHIDGAHNKGGGGNGYGVELHEAFDNKLRNLTINNMRHAIIFSVWHAEISNDIHVARTNRDINFHGSLDHSNRVVVDEIILEYAADRSRSKRRNVWKILSAGGTNHAETDFLSVNDVQLNRAEGSWRDDVMVAADEAVLAGGFGTDRFVVQTGQVVVKDFQTGPSGDILDLPPHANISISQSGADVSIAFEDTEITLQNCRADELTQSNFAQAVPSV